MANNATSSTGARIVVLTGAGISAESGISTFRDSNGLWENHRVEDVATPAGFAANPGLVQRFYDQRRAQLHEVEPNAAHRALARLDDAFPGEVVVITQNVDDLHERAGSRDVIHMHGELRSALCTACGERERILGDLSGGPSGAPTCAHCGGTALRPDIVWFGEQIYGGERIYAAVEGCETFIVIGTSGMVQPAASFASLASAHGAETVLINLETYDDAEFDRVVEGRASEHVPRLVDDLVGAAPRRSPSTRWAPGSIVRLPGRAAFPA